MDYKKSCGHCKKIIRENKGKKKYARKAGEPLIWARLQHYLETNEGNYNPEEYLCPNFQATLLTYCKKSGFEDNGNRAARKPDASNNLPQSSLLKRSIPRCSNEPEATGSAEKANHRSESHEDNANGGDANIHNGVTAGTNNGHGHGTTPDEQQEQDDECRTDDRDPGQSVPKRRCQQDDDQDMEYEESGSGRISDQSSQNGPTVQAEAVYSQSTDSISSRGAKVKFASKMKLRKIFSIGFTEARCIICGDESKEGRKTIPDSAILEVWLRDTIFIPSKCRCCDSHITHGTFKEAAKVVIRNKKRLGTPITAANVQKLILRLTGLLNKKKDVLDFDDLTLKDDVYKELTGLSKDNFQVLLKYIESHLNDTKNRSPRNALAMFMVKLRLGVSQRVIARLFGVTQNVVSTTFNRVRELLMKHFVPSNMGYSHIPREKIIESHNPSFVRELFDVKDENLALLADGTYIFIQHSKDHQLQSETWSPHKHRNLLKFMMVVTPDGYILSAPGPWKSDGKHGDSNIFNTMIATETCELRKYLQAGDHIIADRGFQRTQPVLVSKGMHCSIPPNLNGRPRFEAEEANLSRKVTLVRWVVEAVNGRIKNMFDFFNNVVPNTYIPVIGDLFQIACAIINRFCPPIFQESEKHQKILAKVRNRIEKTNRLQEEIVDNGLLRRGAFRKGEADDVANFPVLGEDDLLDLTLGVYQVENAEYYSVNHLNKDNLYQLLIHKEDEHLIRAQLKSRFRRSIKHNLWIEYDAEYEGAESITGYYCECQVGARVVGMCSHVTAVIWYLSFARHQTAIKRKRKYTEYLLDVAETTAILENPGANAEDDDEPEGVVIHVPAANSGDPFSVVDSQN